MNTLPGINILTPCLAAHDAIGNDVVQMREVLSDCGYTVRVFAEGTHSTRVDFARPLTDAPPELWSSPDDILIYHHSMGWPMGERVLFRTRNKIVLRYHNITPPRFFAPYSPAHREACEQGIESTGRIAGIPDMLVLGDSTFNCDGFGSLGVEPQRRRVLAPLHLTEYLGRELFHLPTVREYSGDVANILFVGGVKPNKGHLRAIRVFAAYNCKFNERSRLIFAGGMDERLGNYVEEIRQWATRLGVGDKVVFVGGVSGSQLKTLYTIADVFLCTSEHEGFCVPLVEAMYFRVPIVAWAVTAVPETLGSCGFLLDDWDEYAFASHIAQLVDDLQLAEKVGDAGRRRYLEEYAPKVLREKLCSLVAEVVLRPGKS